MEGLGFPPPGAMLLVWVVDCQDCYWHGGLGAGASGLPRGSKLLPLYLGFRPFVFLALSLIPSAYVGPEDPNQQAALPYHVYQAIKNPYPLFQPGTCSAPGQYTDFSRHRCLLLPGPRSTWSLQSVNSQPSPEANSGSCLTSWGTEDASQTQFGDQHGYWQGGMTR